MKTTLLAIAVATIASVAFGQQPSSLPPLVSTNGSAQIRVVPDLADLCFEVEVRNADLTLARKQQADRAAKVLAAIRAAGVEEADLQSSPVLIAPDFTNREQETEKVKFYRVSQSVSCTLHEVKKMPDLTAEAVAAGATGVHEATLRTSQLRKYRDEARSKAIRAAREKAVALASELGAKVGKPYSITEGSEHGSSRYSTAINSNIQVALASMDREQAGDGSSATFAPGTISITANINVSFLLE
jgi:uncharacterized protein YggE